MTEAFRDQRDVISGSVARDALGRPGLHLVTPISLDGDRFGMVSAAGSNAAVFAEDDLLLLKALATQLAFALAYRKLLLRLSEAQAREEANELKDDFLSSIAHDLQTPLTTLLGEAQFMDRLAARDPSTPIDRERVRRMIDEAGRMRSMAREMLEANRGEEASLARDVALIDLSAIVREVVDDEAPRGRDLRVTTPETAVVEGDRTSLRQLVRNLVENAIKYSPDGGEVQVALELRLDSVVLAVTDSGIGIAPEDMPHVFERYWRSRRIDDRQFVGTGLGLFLAQRIAQEHGGQISVESALGLGSTFTVTLPRSAQSETTRTACGRDQ